MQKEYTNGELTIVWKPDLCIHAAKCWQGLIEVFDPKKRPWVNPYGASTEKIKAQVDECPSKALSYYMNNQSKAEDMNTEKKETKSADKVKVSVLKNGPLLIAGNITLIDADGNESEKEGENAFCRCGASKNKPFCDGSHETINFEG